MRRADWLATVPSYVTLYRVDDPLPAFRRLAAAWREKLQGPVIALAGSVGKTPTKDLLAALRRGRFATTFATRASEHDFVRIPPSRRRAMAPHLDWVRPTAGFVTASAPGHWAGPDSRDTATREASPASMLAAWQTTAS